MAQNYVMIDGKRIDLSNETTDNLKKALNITEPKQVKVHCFRAVKVKSGGCGYPYNLGGVYDHTTKWDGKCVRSDKAQITCYSTSEVEQIIAGLQELLKS